MKHRTDHYFFIIRLIKNFKWETTDRCMSKLIQGDWKEAWMTLHDREACFNGAQKILA